MLENQDYYIYNTLAGPELQVVICWRQPPLYPGTFVYCGLWQKKFPGFSNWNDAVFLGINYNIRPENYPDWLKILFTSIACEIWCW